MAANTNNENPDVLLIGSGIMSATLGAMLKNLNPDLKIQLYEAANTLSPEASDGWHNAGTGHAGICELSYTPNRGEDGEVDVAKAISIYQEFEHSKQFWGYAVRNGMVENATSIINPVPHIAFVYGQPQVDFLRSRYKGMNAHHFFESMQYTEDRETIKSWAPLLLEGRDPNEPIAATKMDIGSDVNFGSISRQFVQWLGAQDGCSYQTGQRVDDLHETADGWKVVVVDEKTKERKIIESKFVFIGAGGGSLPLLQKSNIKQSKGFGGFPIGGQWLVCDNPELVEQHRAKVYGMSPGAAPTMAVPHLDLRIINGKKALLFGPYAAWTTKFLHETGKFSDLLNSVRLDNIASLIKVGLHNIPLVRYLIQQGTQSMTTRMKELKNFFPDAAEKDWKLIDAGIRVQAIKKEDGDAGIVHFGTEVVTNDKRNISALLGASPGASVSTNIILEIVRKCFKHEIDAPGGYDRLKAMVPTFDEDLIPADKADRQRQTALEAERSLGLRED